MKFKDRANIREHIRKCNQLEIHGPECSDCLKKTFVLLSYGDIKVCPTCAINYDEKITKLFYGAILLNHMGDKYENILRRKISNLMEYVNVKLLPEIGIDIILITFTDSISPITHMVSKDGELIFVLCRVKEIKEREDFVFENVIYHEVMHAYLSDYLKIGITDNFKTPSSYVEGTVGFAVEDTHLTKYCINNEIKPYLKDEIKRDYGYYNKMRVPSESQIEKLSNEQKFAGMLSVTYSYASELFFFDLNISSHLQKQVKRNLKLIKPHVNKFESFNIIDTISNLYKDKIAETEYEKRTIYNKLLISCDEWLDNNNISIY